MYLARMIAERLQIFEVRLPAQFYVEEDREYYAPKAWSFFGGGFAEGVAALDESPERVVRRLETYIDLEARRVRLMQHPSFNRRLTT